MNQWLLTISGYAEQMVSILLVIVLILIIILLIRLIIMIGSLKQTMQKVNTSLDIANDYLGELKVPVRALVNVSMSIEALRAATEATIHKFYDRMSENVRMVAEFFRQLWDNLSQIKKEEQEEAAEKASADETIIVPVKNEDTKGDTEHGRS